MGEAGSFSLDGCEGVRVVGSKSAMAVSMRRTGNGHWAICRKDAGSFCRGPRAASLVGSEDVEKQRCVVGSSTSQAISLKVAQVGFTMATLQSSDRWCRGRATCVQLAPGKDRSCGRYRRECLPRVFFFKSCEQPGAGSRTRS